MILSLFICSLFGLFISLLFKIEFKQAARWEISAGHPSYLSGSPNILVLSKKVFAISISIVSHHYGKCLLHICSLGIHSHFYRFLFVLPASRFSILPIVNISFLKSDLAVLRVSYSEKLSEGESVSERLIHRLMSGGNFPSIVSIDSASTQVFALISVTRREEGDSNRDENMF